MAKVKKMGLGGFFKGVLGGGAKAIGKAVSKSPAVKAIAGGAGTLAKPPIKAIAGGVGTMTKSPGRAGAAALTGVGSAVRGAGSMVKPIRDIGTGMPKPGGMGPRGPRGAVTGLGQANFPRGAAGAAGVAAGRAMKKGGLAAGHKAADGIAKQGKTKAKAVKMAKGGRTC